MAFLLAFAIGTIYEYHETRHPALVLVSFVRSISLLLCATMQFLPFCRCSSGSSTLADGSLQHYGLVLFFWASLDWGR